MNLISYVYEKRHYQTENSNDIVGVDIDSLYGRLLQLTLIVNFYSQILQSTFTFEFYSYVQLYMKTSLNIFTSSQYLLCENVIEWVLLKF